MEAAVGITNSAKNAQSAAHAYQLQTEMTYQSFSM